MERRNFLQGIFGGVVGTGLLLKASPSDIAQFAPPPVGAPIAAAYEPKTISELGEFVFNSKGQPIGVISRVDFHTEAIDVTSAWDSNRRFMPGRPNLTITVQGLAHVKLEHVPGFAR